MVMPNALPDCRLLRVGKDEALVEIADADEAETKAEKRRDPVKAGQFAHVAEKDLANRDQRDRP